MRDVAGAEELTLKGEREPQGGGLRALMAISIRDRRQELGWSQARLAEEAGTSQQTIDRIERGQTTHSRAMDKIAEALGLTPDKEVIATTHMKRKAETFNQIKIWLETSGTDALLPIYINDINARPFKYILKPENLRHSIKSYGLIMLNKHMYPALRVDDILLVDPDQIPKIDDDVVLCVSDGTNAGVHVGTLVAEDEATWTLKEWRPARKDSVPKAEWPLAHVIVGSLREID